jgi:hypothetical protein
MLSAPKSIRTVPEVGEASNALNTNRPDAFERVVEFTIVHVVIPPPVTVGATGVGLLPVNTDRRTRRSPVGAIEAVVNDVASVVVPPSVRFVNESAIYL